MTAHDTAAARKSAPVASNPLDFDAFRIDPAVLVELQNDYSRTLSNLWSSFIEGRAQEPVADKRFGAPEWQGPHAYLAELYLANARYMRSMAHGLTVEPKTKAKIEFAVEQWIDAMSPSNFLATNPEVQRKLIDTDGESLSVGLANMLADMQKGRISQTDESAFEVGRNVAVSAGSVIFRNDIFELIQYRPSTDTVFEKPLLIVPPCINKFYILDLQPDNSFVRHAVDQGHTVYLVSWRNPDASLAHLTWDDYIEEGTIRAVDVVCELARQKTINILGFCVGGTMITTALAVLKARGREPAASLTLLTTLLDFSDTGILDVFVDEEHVQMRERTIGGQMQDAGQKAPVGLMPARDLATSFSFLRPNDLVWNYVVKNYLKGEAPPAFDLLFWNADSTNLPGPFFVWYLRNTYLENKLKVPGRLTVCGEKIDLGALSMPAYIYGSREDHIVPWPAAYANLAILSGPKRFVLGASGHIAGVINSALRNKRNYWAYPPGQDEYPDSNEQFLASATSVPGSWWPDWSAWLAGFAGKKVKAPGRPGNTKYRAIEPAPGAYVRVRAT